MGGVEKKLNNLDVRNTFAESHSEHRPSFSYTSIFKKGVFP
jgi:hypothetical protein